MIIGIGTDIVYIKRIKFLLTKYNNNFKQRILHKDELHRLSSIPEVKHTSFLAKRFAAKEAISKAFGCGIGEELQFRNIIITTNNSAPSVNIISNVIDVVQYKIHLSISDDYLAAIAFAVISI